MKGKALRLQWVDAETIDQMLSMENPGPHARLAIAGMKGRGIRLTADEVSILLADDAILMAAANEASENPP